MFALAQLSLMAGHSALLLFGLTVSACLTDPSWLHCPRDLHVVEIFAGVASIAAAAKAAGYQAVAFDKSRVPGLTDSLSSKASEDVTCEHGFLHAFSLVMRLQVGGLLWLAPDMFLLGLAECLQYKTLSSQRLLWRCKIQACASV